jgi:hypothetical protein
MGFLNAKAGSPLCVILMFCYRCIHVPQRSIELTAAHFVANLEKCSVRGTDTLATRIVNGRPDE